MKKKNIILILLVLFTIVILFLLKGENPTTLKSENVLGSDLPFKLSTEQISKSLETNQPITMEPVKFNWPEIINNSLLKNGYELVFLQSANDGGSKFYYYLKTKDVPAIKFSYHWDMSKGQYKSLSVDFIYPSQIDSWLTKIENLKALMKN